MVLIHKTKGNNTYVYNRRSVDTYIGKCPDKCPTHKKLIVKPVKEDQDEEKEKSKEDSE